MDNYTKWRKILITSIGIFLLFIIGISAGGRESVNIIENLLSKIVIPVQSAVSSVGSGIDSKISPIFQVWNTAKENEILKKENIELRTKVIEYTLKEQELSQLLALKGALKYVKDENATKFITTDVIGKVNNNWYTILTISAGKNAGVKKNSTVINESGMIGSVFEVGDYYSKVVTLLDEKTSISFETVDPKNSFEGITNGSENGLIKGKLYDPNADVKVGQTVITSGLGVHPRGIIIGTITNVVQDKNDFLLNIEIKSDANFRKIDKLMVLIK